MPGDVDAVGLSIGYAPVFHIDVVWLFGSSQVVPDLQVSYRATGKRPSAFSLAVYFRVTVTSPTHPLLQLRLHIDPAPSTPTAAISDVSLDPPPRGLD